MEMRHMEDDMKTRIRDSGEKALNDSVTSCGNAK